MGRLVTTKRRAEREMKVLANFMVAFFWRSSRGVYLRTILRERCDVTGCEERRLVRVLVCYEES